MSVDLTPGRDTWPAITRGDTLPASNYKITGTTTILSRVRCKVANSSGTVQFTLDSSTSGITLNSTAAGSWDFDIDIIPTATTEALTAGIHQYDIETIDNTGAVSTEVKGTWQILPQITDT